MAFCSRFALAGLLLLGATPPSFGDCESTALQELNRARELVKLHHRPEAQKTFEEVLRTSRQSCLGLSRDPAIKEFADLLLGRARENKDSSLAKQAASWYEDWLADFQAAPRDHATLVLAREVINNLGNALFESDETLALLATYLSHSTKTPAAFDNSAVTLWLKALDDPTVDEDDREAGQDAICELITIRSARLSTRARRRAEKRAACDE